MRLPLLGGSYVARSRIANVQRCINYFPETNRQDSPVPFTFYQRPGLRFLQAAPAKGSGRMVYRASNGSAICCIGNTIYKIGPDFTYTALGTIATSSGPVRAIDNGGTIIICDGSSGGWLVDMETFAFSQVNDATFHGANTLAILDTYILWNMPGTVFFGSTLSNVIEFDPLFFAGKVAYPDPIQGIIVNRHELVLFGSLKSEIWYNAGNPTFPFAQLPGAYIEHGCAAAYSIASIDIQTYWLGQDLEGKGVVFGLSGYDVKRISNHALEVAIQSMPDISDAFAYTYQQGGHYFYVLTFPSGNQTWVYDSSLQKDPDMAWHQRCWTDSQGNLNRERLGAVGYVNDLIVGLDWENGNMYALDTNYFFDDFDPVNPSPISCIKGFPHLLQAKAAGGAPGQFISSELHRMRYNSFYLDIECGDHPLQSDGTVATVTLRVSVDRGQSYFDAPLQATGAPGEYQTLPTWRQTVANARDVVFEIFHTIGGPAALNGAFVDADILES